MEIKAGRYATMKDGRTILIEKTDEAGGLFGGKEISSPCMPYVVAYVKDIDHIAKKINIYNAF